jgi:hypothetical protein
MGRREKLIQITAEGRDRGKTFMLREMPADQGERWAIRMLLALANGGAKLPDGVLEAGMAGLAVTMPALIAVGLRSLAGLRYEDVAPLLDEMMGCVQYIPPGQLPAQGIMAGEYAQIEEIATRLQLRYEVLQLHVGFSLAGGASTTDTNPSAPPAC